MLLEVFDVDLGVILVNVDITPAIGRNCRPSQSSGTTTTDDDYDKYRDNKVEGYWPVVLARYHRSQTALCVDPAMIFFVFQLQRIQGRRHRKKAVIARLARRLSNMICRRSHPNASCLCRRKRTDGDSDSMMLYFIFSLNYTARQTLWRNRGVHSSRFIMIFSTNPGRSIPFDGVADLSRRDNKKSRFSRVLQFVTR